MKTVTRIVLTWVAFVAVTLFTTNHVKAATINLPKDTLVKLRFTDPVSTRTAAVGQQMNMRVADDVYLGTKLIIKKDEPLLSTITQVQKPRSWGRSGKLNLEFGTVKAVDGSQVALGPWTKDKNQGYGSAAGATVGGAIILGPVGLVGGMFVKGKHIDVPVGKEVAAAVRWDSSVVLADAPVQPVAALPAPAAAPVAPLAPAPVNVSGVEATVSTVPPPVVTPAPAPAVVQPPKSVEKAAVTPKSVPGKQAANVKTEAKASVMQQPKVIGNPPHKVVPVKTPANPPYGLQKPPTQIKPVIPIIEDVTPRAGKSKKS